MKEFTVVTTAQITRIYKVADDVSEVVAERELNVGEVEKVIKERFNADDVDCKVQVFVREENA